MLYSPIFASSGDRLLLFLFEIFLLRYGKESSLNIHNSYLHFIWIRDNNKNSYQNLPLPIKLAGSPAGPRRPCSPLHALKAEFLLPSHYLSEQLGEALLLPLRALGQDLSLLYSLDILNAPIDLFLTPPWKLRDTSSSLLGEVTLLLYIYLYDSTKKWEPDVVVHAFNSSTRVAEQVDCWEFKTSLGYIVRPCLKETKREHRF